MTQHLYAQHPEDAWFEMFETYKHRAALKANAGVEARGRDNKAPVLHYTLSWHASDNPSEAHMQNMALESLKALGLSEHQAVMSAHEDKEHKHVHVVANTVHPYSGRTAPLKFTKLEFSKWAEAYEKEHGIHCEQRIVNNERRRELANLRQAEKLEQEAAKAKGAEPPAKKPFVPVKDKSPTREQWFERKDVINKMKALRAALDLDLKGERNAIWARQLSERESLHKETEDTLARAREHVKSHVKPQWRSIYASQVREQKRIARLLTHPLERAVYVYSNRVRFGTPEKPLSLRAMIPLILSPKKLLRRSVWQRDKERKILARYEKGQTKKLTDPIFEAHRTKFHAMKDRQKAERDAERQHQVLSRQDISFARAKAELVREQQEAPPPKPKVNDLIARPPTKEAEGIPMAPPSKATANDLVNGAPKRLKEQEGLSKDFNEAERAVKRKDKPEDILKQLEEWKRTNRGNDFDMER